MPKTIKLELPKNYIKSIVLENSSPLETELILEYGEKLLESHKILVTANITDKRYKQVETELSREKRTNKNLTKDIEKLNQESKEALFYSQQKHDEELNEQRAEELNKHNKKIAMIQAEAEADVNIVNQDRKKLKEKNMSMQRDYEQERNSMKQKITEELNGNHKIVIGNLEKEKQVLKQENENMQAKHEKSLNITEQKAKAMHDETKIDLKMRLTELKENAKAMQEKHDEIIERTKEELKTQYTKEINDLTIQNGKLLDNRNWMKYTFANVLDYHEKNNTSTRKGEIGEQMIIEILKEFYSKAIITNTSKEVHCCDVLFKSDNPHIKCIIEVKKKQSIEPRDVTKFKNDVKIQQGNGINCALFISMDSNNIPTKGNFHLEFQNKIPVLYVCLKNPYIVKISIELLKFITCKITSVSNEEIPAKEFHNSVSITVSDLYYSISSSQNQIQKSIMSMRKQLYALEKTDKELGQNLKLLSKFSDIYKQLNISLSTGEQSDEKLEYSESEIKKLREWVKKNNKVPKRDEIVEILELNTYQAKNRNVKDMQKKLKVNLVKLKKVKKSKSVLLEKEAKSK